MASTVKGIKNMLGFGKKEEEQPTQKMQRPSSSSSIISDKEGKPIEIGIVSEMPQSGSSFSAAAQPVATTAQPVATTAPSTPATQPKSMAQLEHMTVALPVANPTATPEPSSTTAAVATSVQPTTAAVGAHGADPVLTDKGLECCGEVILYVSQYFETGAVQGGTNYFYGGSSATPGLATDDPVPTPQPSAAPAPVAATDPAPTLTVETVEGLKSDPLAFWGGDTLEDPFFLHEIFGGKKKFEDGKKYCVVYYEKCPDDGCFDIYPVKSNSVWYQHALKLERVCREHFGANVASFDEVYKPRKSSKSTS